MTKSRARGSAKPGQERRLRRHDAEPHRQRPCGGRSRSFCHRCRVVPRLRAACLARQQGLALPAPQPERPSEALGDVAAAASLQLGLCGDPYRLEPGVADPEARAAADERMERCRSLLDALLRPAWPAEAARWADALIARFGSLPATLSARTSERARIVGATPSRFLGSVQASLLHGLRLRLAERPIVSTSRQLLDYLKADKANLINERFRVLFLTAQNELLADDLVWEGTVGEAPAYPREVVKRALEVGAAGLILVHNHPSGSHQPSEGDIDATRRIVSAASAMGICVHDHLVISRAGWASFRRMGLLDPPAEAT